MSTTINDTDLDRTLSRAEVEDLFAPGTPIVSRSVVDYVAGLERGGDLFGFDEDEEFFTLWVTFERSRAAILVGNALHYLSEGSWRILDAEDLSGYVECVECEALVRIGSPSHFGAFVAEADFCSEPCRDDYLAANTDTAPEDA